MAPRQNQLIPLILCLSISFIVPNLCAVNESIDLDELKVYIVHVKSPPLSRAMSTANRWVDMYASLLENATKTLGFNSHGRDFVSSRIIHAYSNVMTGFSAMLTTREVQALSKLDWYLRAYPSPIYWPLTTHTPQFLGMNHRRFDSVWNVTNMGEGIIIGVLDTGVTPGHPSYDDDEMPSPPAKWKGRCDLNGTVCNNKLIGARSFVNYDVVGRQSTESPVDNSGHGTHTSSIAAGAFVKNTSMSGIAKGMAVGMAPRAHIAIYKVCSGRCRGDDVLAAIDAAVEDGVDVLSISLGQDEPTPFYDDPVAIGGLYAMKKRVFVSCSAGNTGPKPSSVINDAPWLLTVAASTMDRSISSIVKLGDGQQFQGQSSYQPHDFGSNLLPLVYFGLLGNKDAAHCTNGSLNGLDVRGKIVVCDHDLGRRINKGQIIKSAGGAGMILVNAPFHGYTTLAELHVLPASHISYADGLKIKAYINSTQHPTTTFLFSGTIMGVPHSPAISSFSSRGPSKFTPGILKPDITGPGVNVLAAWPSPKFNMESGTSMSCPHLSGIAALIMKAHPHWSPAAVKSAIMTTAYMSDNIGQPILDERNLQADFFALGAGHVDPQKAIDPGLVYDLRPKDFYPYLCGLGYTDDGMHTILRKHIRCSTIKSIPEAQLNYPSITVHLSSNQSSAVMIMRTVTNVGEPTSQYQALVDVPMGISVEVVPTILSFKAKREKQSFTVSINRTRSIQSGALEGQLRWVSLTTRHVVRSPISIILG